jgi:catechol 2,3-dioxygenase-like lactoylglutathione lyase family enzyme
MATKLWGVVIAAIDPEAQARWWAQALGWDWWLDFDADGRVRCADPSVPELLFERVHDTKTVQNRLHLDLASQSDEEQRAIVDRLRHDGATRVDVGQGEVPWVVLADPEGNELCVLEPSDRYRGAPGLASIVLHVNDPERMAAFWSAATGWPIADRGDRFVSLHRPGDRPPDLDLIRVPEPKSVKARLHLDVETGPDSTQAAEVARLVGLGAMPADVGQVPDAGWTVLADPEGDEFCVVDPQEP